MTDTVALRQPWYRGLNRHQWNILLAANLGWLFDGFELYALILTVGPAMRSSTRRSIRRFPPTSARSSPSRCWVGALAASSAACSPTTSGASAR